VSEVRDLCKSFGTTQVLSDVYLTFADGEVTSVLGPSGSGKSTLIRCINGLEKLTGGDIRVNGLSVNRKRDLSEIRKQCAMVFQQLNLFLHLTAPESVTLAPVQVLHVHRA
jgi:ABC-type polar amino acid transport system ATPase subunit